MPFPTLKPLQIHLCRYLNMLETFVRVNVTWTKVYANGRGTLRIHYSHRRNLQWNQYVNIELIWAPDFRLSVRRLSLETWNCSNSVYFWDKCLDWLTSERMDSLFQQPVCCLQEGWRVWRVCSPVRTHREYYQQQVQEVGTQRNRILFDVECENCFEEPLLVIFTFRMILNKIENCSKCKNGYVYHTIYQRWPEKSAARYKCIFRRILVTSLSDCNWKIHNIFVLLMVNDSLVWYSCDHYQSY